MFGWSRDSRGFVVNYHRVSISNTITQSVATSGTQRPIVSAVYETE